MKKLFSLNPIKILSLLWLLSLVFSLQVSAVKVEIPEGNRESDVMVSPQETQVEAWEKDIFALIQIINKYLRFALGLVCMIGLVIGGFRLITSQGNEEASKKATNVLLGATIGIIISVLSYSVIRLVVNLF